MNTEASDIQARESVIGIYLEPFYVKIDWKRES